MRNKEIRLGKLKMSEKAGLVVWHSQLSEGVKRDATARSQRSRDTRRVFWAQCVSILTDASQLAAVTSRRLC